MWCVLLRLQVGLPARQLAAACRRRGGAAASTAARPAERGSPGHGWYRGPAATGAAAQEWNGGRARSHLARRCFCQACGGGRSRCSTRSRWSANSAGASLTLPQARAEKKKSCLQVCTALHWSRSICDKLRSCQVTMVGRPAHKGAKSNYQKVHPAKTSPPRADILRPGAPDSGRGRREGMRGAAQRVPGPGARPPPKFLSAPDVSELISGPLEVSWTSLRGSTRTATGSSEFS